jgi:hypothetical protein
MLTFEKNFIEFHREFYFWERFEKRVFPTDPLSRTDTFGTHCKSQSIEVAHFENFFSFYLSIPLKNLNLSVKQLSSLLQDLKKKNIF